MNFPVKISQLYNELIGFAMQRCGNREESEEAVQDTFLRITQNIHKFDARVKFSTWACKILINIMSDRIKAQKRRAKRLALLEHDKNIKHSRYINNLNQRFLEASSGLEERDKQIVELILEGKKHPKIAEQLDMRKSTVQRRISKIISPYLKQKLMEK